MLKLAENPPILHPPAGSLAELTGTWWVAHTRARNEKAFAWDLFNLDQAYYLPLVRRTIFSGGRRRLSLMPLFASYVFINGDDQTRHAALTTNRVANIIAVDDQPQLITELCAIERLLATGAQIDPVPFAAVGKLVKIARGPFKGIIGRVIRRDGVMRLSVFVSILGRGAEMEIDSDILEALDEG